MAKILISAGACTHPFIMPETLSLIDGQLVSVPATIDYPGARRVVIDPDLDNKSANVCVHRVTDVQKPAGAWSWLSATESPFIGCCDKCGFDVTAVDKEKKGPRGAMNVRIQVRLRFFCFVFFFKVALESSFLFQLAKISVVLWQSCLVANNPWTVFRRV